MHPPAITPNPPARHDGAGHPFPAGASAERTPAVKRGRRGVQSAAKAMVPVLALLLGACESTPEPAPEDPSGRRSAVDRLMETDRPQRYDITWKEAEPEPATPANDTPPGTGRPESEAARKAREALREQSGRRRGDGASSSREGRPDGAAHGEGRAGTGNSGELADKPAERPAEGDCSTAESKHTRSTLGLDAIEAVIEESKPVPRSVRVQCRVELGLTGRVEAVASRHARLEQWANGDFTQHLSQLLRNVIGGSAIDEVSGADGAIRLARTLRDEVYQATGVLFDEVVVQNLNIVNITRATKDTE